jgi:tight adherence protein C
MNAWLDEWLPLSWLALCTASLVMLLHFWRRRAARAEERLIYADPDGDELPPPLLGRWMPALAGLMPLPEATRADLERDLRQAGYYRPTALAEYLALRALLVVAPLFTAAILALLVAEESIDEVLTLGGVASVLGYSLPRVYLFVRGRTRARQMERGLPLAIDLLTLCLTAGQNLLASLRQVSLELRFSQPVLAQELAIASRQAELHSLGQAMKQWSDRVNVPDVTNVALLIIQSERLGTDAANTLGELANNFRTTRRQRAESQANRASFWMLFPSVFCFWVASAIILTGPAYVDFLQLRQNSSDLFDKTKENINRANARPNVQPNTELTPASNNSTIVRPMPATRP